jgi:hypothetical protein
MGSLRTTVLALDNTVPDHALRVPIEDEGDVGISGRIDQGSPSWPGLSRPPTSCFLPTHVDARGTPARLRASSTRFYARMTVNSPPRHGRACLGHPRLAFFHRPGCAGDTSASTRVFNALLPAHDSEFAASGAWSSGTPRRSLGAER